MIKQKSSQIQEKYFKIFTMSIFCCAKMLWLKIGDLP